jgi:hypothetical protein
VLPVAFAFKEAVEPGAPTDMNQERVHRLERWNRLLDELARAPIGTDTKALRDRIDAMRDDIARAMGLTEAEIAEANRRTAKEVAKKTQREIEIGLSVFRRALLGDDAALEEIRIGCHEFAVAVGEGAITANNLKTLPASVRAALEEMAGKPKH